MSATRRTRREKEKQNGKIKECLWKDGRIRCNQFALMKRRRRWKGRKIGNREELDGVGGEERGRLREINLAELENQG